MTGVAIVSRVDVARIFTTGSNAIVAGNTIVHEPAVVYGGDCRPVAGDMATVTL